jgi:hypothetical protein
LRRPWLHNTAAVLKAIWKLFYRPKTIKKNETTVNENANLPNPPYVNAL